MPTPRTAYSYLAKVKRWVDGDTLDVSIDLGFEIEIAIRVRLYGVNTPETNSANPREREDSKAALSLASELAPPGSAVQLRTYKDNDKYGRYLASVTTVDGTDVALSLIASALGEEYYGGKR